VPSKISDRRYENGPSSHHRAKFHVGRWSAANISETDEDFQNWIFIPFTAISPALGETSPVNFGSETLEISM